MMSEQERQPRTIYLAGKLNQGEQTIMGAAADLESRGHTILEKWWSRPTTPKPYLDHPEESGEAADAMIEAAYQSEVFVLLSNDTMLGAAVELGAAIASKKQNADKEILLVKPYGVRQSIFYAHPAVIAIQSLAHLREREWY